MTKPYRYAVEVKVLITKTGKVIVGNQHTVDPAGGWAEEIAGDNSWGTALQMIDLHSGYCSEIEEGEGYIRIKTSPNMRPGKYRIIRDEAGILVLASVPEQESFTGRSA